MGRRKILRHLHDNDIVGLEGEGSLRERSNRLEFKTEERRKKNRKKKIKKRDKRYYGNRSTQLDTDVDA